MIGLIILGISVIMVGICLRVWNGAPSFFDIIIVILGNFFLYLGIFINMPTALEVYQGKTTLEITYKDGVPIDSVVVFKDKKH